MPYLKTIDDCNIYYELAGEGATKPTITFINGTLQTTVNWKPVVKAMVANFRMVMYDGRGQGASDLGDKPLSMDLHASDLKQLLTELNIQQTAVVGISHGARIALALAAAAPDLISRMVLCSISTRATFRAKIIVRSWYEILQRHSLDAMVWAALPHVFGRMFLRDNEKHLERIVKTIVRRNHTESLRAHLAALQNYPPLRNVLGNLPFLSLLLTGEDDPLVTREGAEETAAICGGRHMELEGIGHSIPAEAPRRFIRLIGDFLADG
jgi:pimeloyl-ACP methyl ester carboxylesterase